MDRAKVVVNEVQGDRMCLAINIHRESTGEPFEPADVHPHSQVLALYVAGRYQ